MIARSVILWALASTIGLAGCAVTRKPDEPKILRLAPTFSQAGPLQPGSLAIAAVVAGGLAGDRRLVYVDRASPRELRQAATLFWDEPPPRIVERALVAGLRTKFSTVIGPETALPADRRVLARLERFEQESSGASDAGAAVTIDVTVVSTTDRKVLLTGKYCAIAPIAGASNTERVHAFETAMQQTVDALAATWPPARAAQPAAEASTRLR